MVELISTTSGLFPLPDWAKEELSDLKGHQRTDLISGDESPEVEAVYDAARETMIGEQLGAELGLVVEGQLRWDDMLAHPLAVHDAVETRGLLRYYDNNNFYREPVVTDPLTFDGDIADELERAAEVTDNLHGVLPGPYSLFDLATDEHYGDEEAFLSALGEFLAEEAAAFPGLDALFLLEPSLVVEPPAAQLRELAVEGVSSIAEAVDAPVVVHTYWGTPTDGVHGALIDAGVGVGYDLVTDPEGCRRLVEENGTGEVVSLGVVDGQNTRLEDPVAVRELADGFLEHAGAHTAYLTANTELFYLPENRFVEKLALLGAATTPEVAA